MLKLFLIDFFNTCAARAHGHVHVNVYFGVGQSLIRPENWEAQCSVAAKGQNTNKTFSGEDASGSQGACTAFYSLHMKRAIFCMLLGQNYPRNLCEAPEPIQCKVNECNLTTNFACSPVYAESEFAFKCFAERDIQDACDSC